MAHPVRVFLVDDHAAVRQALAAQLRAAEIALVGEAGEAEAALHQVEQLRPDVVLVETKRADGRGLELVGLLTRPPFGVRVIVLTSYLSEWEQWAAYRAGASRYLLKDIGSAQLLAEIRAVQ